MEPDWGPVGHPKAWAFTKNPGAGRKGGAATAPQRVDTHRGNPPQGSRRGSASQARVKQGQMGQNIGPFFPWFFEIEPIYAVDRILYGRQFLESNFQATFLRKMQLF